MIKLTTNQTTPQLSSQMESLQAAPKPVEPGFSPGSSPRISFSAEFLDENNFISICPNPRAEKQTPERAPAPAPRNVEFEFLSGKLTNMIAADELFSEGKLLPFWQMHHAEKLDKISLKTENADVTPRESNKNSKGENRINWFLDDDPSPRPPKCTVLWKELLRLKKQRAGSTLTPSSSSSSSTNSAAENPSADHERREGTGINKEKVVKRIKKGLERTRSANIRIRPVINVPICNVQGKNSGLPPLFSARKAKLLER